MHRRPRIRTLLTALVLAVAGLVCATSVPRAEEAPTDTPFRIETDKRIQRRVLRHGPLPEPPVDPTNRYAGDADAAHFGQYLFFDERLSATGDVSCATCHDPKRSFADAVPIGEGIGPGQRHTPTLWNAAYQRWFFWDGRADSLWAQALKPIETPNELGSSRMQLARLIANDASLRTAYESIFGSLPDLSDTERFPVSACPSPDRPDDPKHTAWIGMSEADRAAVDRIYVNCAKAIAAYETRLVSRDSAFDRYTRALRAGDSAGMAAYPAAAKRGAELFVGAANCRLCHTGPNFTDGEFHSTGVAPRNGGPLRDAARYEGIPKVLNDPFNAAGSFSDKADGDAAEELQFLSRSPEAWGQFKTPTLRNIARTAPYMHEGQFETLDEVLRFYNTLEGAAAAGHHGERLLVPLDLSESEIADLRAFLETLTDEALAPSLLTQPESPIRD